MRGSLSSLPGIQDRSLGIGIGGVAQTLGCSASTVRRLLRDNATFPKPFRLTERGDLCWSRDEIVNWFQAQAQSRRVAVSEGAAA
jgi:predicted DNA-binding transcriptional regulator AlpA